MLRISELRLAIGSSGQIGAEAGSSAQNPSLFLNFINQGYESSDYVDAIAGVPSSLLLDFVNLQYEAL